MTTDDIETLAEEVDRLDREAARRVARLVLECRASLRDALEAVEMADKALQQPAAPKQRRGLLDLFGRRRQRQIGMR